MAQAGEVTPTPTPSHGAARLPVTPAGTASHAELLRLLYDRGASGTLPATMEHCAALLGIALETSRNAEALLEQARRDASDPRSSMRVARELWQRAAMQTERQGDCA